jgi:hypothetical protein
MRYAHELLDGTLIEEGGYGYSGSIYCVLGSIVGWTNGARDIEENPQGEMYSDNCESIVATRKGR